MDRSLTVGRVRALVALLAVVFAGSAGAQEIALDPAAGSTSLPAVSARPQGGFVVAWTRDRHVPLSFGPDAFIPQTLVWLPLRPNGVAAGPRRIASDAGPTGIVLLPQVAADELGAALAWGRPAGLGFLLASRRAAPGSPVATLAACESGTLRGLRLVPTANGSWLVWNESCDGLRVVAQRLDARARPTSTARVLAGVNALVGGSFDAAATPEGGLVAAWTQRVVDDQGDHRALVARSFRPDGRPRGPAFRVGPPSTEIAVAADAKGRLFVAWRDNGPIFAGGFRADGTHFVAARPVSPFEDVSESSPRWSNVEHGGLVLVWERLREGEPQGCMARRFDGTGPRGGELAVAERCLAPAVALSGGRTLAVWERPAENPELDNASRALARLLPPGAW